MNYQESLTFITASPDSWRQYLADSLYRYKLPFEDNLSLYIARPDEKIFLPADFSVERFGYHIPLTARILSVPSGRAYYASTELQLTEGSSGVTVWDKVHNPGWLLEQLESEQTDLLQYIEQAIIACIDTHSQHQLFSYTLSAEEQQDMYTALKNSAVYAVASRCGLDCGKYAATFTIFSSLHNYNATAVGLPLDIMHNQSLVNDFCSLTFYIAREVFQPIDKIYKLQTEPVIASVAASVSDRPSVPVLTFAIPFSEYGLELFPTGISFAHANALLHALDSIYQAVPGYYKTDFNISIYGGAEDFTFKGRYDIGSEGVDLLGHIRAFIDMTNDDLPKEKAWSEENISSFFSVLEANITETEEEAQQIRQALASISLEEVIAEGTENKQDLPPVQNYYQLFEDTNIYFNRRAYTVVYIAPDGEVTVSQADMPLLRFSYPMTELQALMQDDTRNEYLLTDSASAPVEAALPKKDVVLRAKLGEQFLLSPAVVDVALRLGTNEPYGLERICAFFAKGYSEEENAQFLRNEYGRHGKGFFLNGIEISLWFDREGIYINEGKFAIGKNGVILTWTDAQKRIAELLELGEYAPQAILDNAVPFEKENLARKLLYLTGDFSSEAVNAGYLPTVREIYETRKGYPETTKTLAQQLNHTDIVDRLIHETSDFIPTYAEKRELLRFHYHKPTELLNALTGLLRPPTIYAASPDFHFLEPKQFITNDEIDHQLTISDNQTHGQKLRIYAFFMEKHTKKDQISFLKETYGLGGGGCLGFHENHDSKGITISRETRHFETLATISLSWSKIERRINELIQQTAYLNELEVAYLPTHKKNEVAKSVYYFFDHTLSDVPCPYPRGMDFEDSIAYISGLLDSPTEVASIYDMMLSVLKTTASDDRMNNQRSAYMQDLLQYRDTLLQEEISEHPNLEPSDTPEQAEMPVQENQTLNNSFSALADTFEIYQLSDEESTRYHRFMGMEYLEHNGLTVQASNYDLVYSGSLSDSANDVSSVLEKLYTQFNAALPADYTGRSLSVSDVIVLRGNESFASYYVDTIGFKCLPEFLREKLAPAHPNYRITDKEIGVGTPNKRFNNNIAAIRTLKALEKDTIPAGADEQASLANYVGWGGLSDYFNPNHAGYGELHSLLTEEEFVSARASTLTAFYTPPVVMEAMYSAITDMQLPVASILDPACGIGSFTGMIPDALRDAAFYGVEIDSISARIAKQLYPEAHIIESRYEKTTLAENSFDLAIGNVPFGSEGVIDKKYDKHNFLIHDYFFAKTIDMVRPGGIIAFVTSKGTMDKKSSKVRKYLAERADLLGAIRLPNNTFKAAAGTEVTSDILFLQKRGYQIVEMPEWVYVNTSPDGILTNEYFISHPEMILGEMKMISTAYGFDSACIARPDDNLADLLKEAVKRLSVPEKYIAAKDSKESLVPARKDTLTDSTGIVTIPSDPRIKPYSYGLIDGVLYYRETVSMSTLNLPEAKRDRLLGILEIRDTLRELIDLQVDDYPDSTISEKRAQLNEVYDKFVSKYGYVSNRDNAQLVAEDNAAPLILSIEKTDKDNTELRQKSAIFFTRTIRPHVEVTHVDTAAEALLLSMSQHACINIPYMEQLTGKTEADLFSNLQGAVFLNPSYAENVKNSHKYLPADEYLSGNIREKLAEAKAKAELFPKEYAGNVTALESVMPKDLTASEIAVSLGATWVPAEYFQQFMYELFQTPTYAKMSIKLEFSKITSTWHISHKYQDYGNLKVSNEYGTDEMNGYVILEASMNLKPATVTEIILTPEGKERRVTNPEKTALARGKQELIKEAFANWVWDEPERRRDLCAIYNERFNSCRPREYDGSFVTLNGSNPSIELYEHQRSAISRGLLGGNTLLAHAVGAGKTIEIAAIAQESKRLGLATKSMIVVPKPLVQQWGIEYVSLYPNANILVAASEDFTAENRKRFCGRIAAGDYDAIILSHSQFEKIPMSTNWRADFLEQQRDELLNFEYEAKQESGNHFSIKDAERSRKRIEKKLKSLYSEDRKDDMITFEALGIDKLFVDEAHYFKNLGVTTKLSHVSGISQTEAQKSSDMYMKCRYMDSITNEKGVVFATGTPISNSMVELYTMQKYLQYSVLNKRGLLNFDAWASTFGEVVTASELAPEGTGYREKSRFAKFFNLPELIGMFKECADIRTADTLNLKGLPHANYHSIVLDPSEIQQEYVASLADRAEAIRAGSVDSSSDNMLVVTNDGRKVALDQRLVSPDYPDDDNSKVSAAAETIYTVWKKTTEHRSTQLVFCDLSTPGNKASVQLSDMSFTNVYDDLKKKLINKGIPKEDIVFIHSANTDEKRITLFEKVRQGNVRVLIGSTQKMGAGMNVQDKIIAEHDLDCPWRPSDLEQRRGRPVRPGNENEEVYIFTYIKKGTFDAYMYQLLEVKQRYISQIMTSKTPVRQVEDVDEAVLSYAEIKALATGNPLIKEKMDLDIEVSRLKLQSAAHKSQQYELQDKLALQFPKEQASIQSRISALSKDIEADRDSHSTADAFCPITVAGHTYTDKKEGAEAFLYAVKNLSAFDEPVKIGSYRGFTLALYLDSEKKSIYTYVRGNLTYRVPLGDDAFGNLQRIDNRINDLPEDLSYAQSALTDLQVQIKNATEILAKPFAKENELTEKSARLAVVTALIMQDSKPDVPAAQEQYIDIDKHEEIDYER